MFTGVDLAFLSRLMEDGNDLVHRCILGKL